MFRIVKIALRILSCLVLLALLFVGVLAVTEYRPADIEKVAVSGAPDRVLHVGDSLSVLTWNIGYGALGDNADFFMDGGTHVITADRERVHRNLEGMQQAITDLNPDLLLLQEVDASASRSYGIDERPFFTSLFPSASAFAPNFKVLYVPYPIPPIGHVEAGILTVSRFPVQSSDRLQLPVPFSWPMRLVNLKRCLMVSRLPVEGTDAELVLVNLHLEAYDEGEGKLLQTRELAEVLQREAAAGNYVIAGGDFNQVFSNLDTSMYPVYAGNWQAGVIDASLLGNSFRCLMDPSNPTCRYLSSPYTGAEDFQYYMLDGFIVSGNILVDSIETQDLHFRDTDHNPVLLKVRLEAQE